MAGEPISITAEAISNGWAACATVATLAIAAITALYLALRAETKGRLDDQREMARTLIATNQVLNALNSSNDARTDVMIKSVDAQESTTQAVARLSVDLTSWDGSLEALRDEMRRLREYLISVGMRP